MMKTILTVDEAAAILRGAEKFGFQPIVALGLFAGFRFEESVQWNWADVRIDEVIKAGKRSKRNGFKIATPAAGDAVNNTVTSKTVKIKVTKSNGRERA